jgi:hypothetical protein
MLKIGGYFELELPKGKELHKNCVRLNSGRNSLEYILRANEYKKIFIPYYTCSVVMEPIIKLNIDYEYYRIDRNFLPMQISVGKNDAILYTNYFGIMSDNIPQLRAKHENIILDNTQAFFAKPLSDVDSFYSCRKYFGVPDGGYVYSRKKLADKFERNKIIDNTSHLLERIENGPESGYKSFIRNDKAFDNKPILKMSRLTEKIMQSIDYDYVYSRRNQNFKYVHSRLSDRNQFTVPISNNICGPLVYPFLYEHNTLRDELIEKKIFIPLYWENVLRQVQIGTREHNLAKYLLPLPIDQRYSIKHMRQMCDMIEQCIDD